MNAKGKHTAKEKKRAKKEMRVEGGTRRTKNKTQRGRRGKGGKEVNGHFAKVLCVLGLSFSNYFVDCEK